MTARVGGHPGAVCGVGGKALLIQADGVAREAGDAFDVLLGIAAREQRTDGGLQRWWLPDVQPLASSEQGRKSNALPVGPHGAKRNGLNGSDHRCHGGSVRVARCGALWVAGGDLFIASWRKVTSIVHRRQHPELLLPSAVRRLGHADLAAHVDHRCS